ncbi:MAG: phosphoribosylamine--glycine ligase [Bacteroidia bacterium]|nr:phosphoribosylamine--glycine ligase [Bacteroidia bacterium]
MNILILGSGGREHVYADMLGKSILCDKLFVAPGNAGTSDVAENIDMQVTDFEKIASFCLSNKIEMLIPGGEDALVAGIYDYFEADEKLKHIKVIGPSKAGAMLEGSKDFSKAFMQRHGVPTAAYATFNSSNAETGKSFLKTLKPPYVLKADGLAAGKGVLIIEDLKEAESALDEMLLNKKFGAASSKVVIEEYLHGIELSVFVLTDGTSYKILPAAKDYKRIGEGDTGLNTGGMGAISPVPFANEEFIKKVEDRVVKPTIAGLKAENITYKGIIFIGLMNVDGNPQVIEYNVRMGDPETEVVFPRIETDLGELLWATGIGKLSETELKISDKTAATVFMVSGGYPEAFEKGYEITGLDNVTGSKVYHAGTTLKDGKTVTNGGRILAITSLGNTIDEAVKTSFMNCDKIQYTNKYFRKDIGKDLTQHG